MTADDGTLLVVDDELFLRGAVAASLRFLGFEVAVAENGTDALRLARNSAFDLLILDVMLPDIDGFEIVRRLRREGNRVPVIFLTAKDTQDDKVTGLTIGGDDYMTKPFGLEELAARVRTVLRRTRPVPVVRRHRLIAARDRERRVRVVCKFRVNAARAEVDTKFTYGSCSFCRTAGEGDACTRLYPGCTRHRRFS